MAIQLGDTAPDFVQNSTEGEISFHDWIGDNWCVLFSHPKTFTPVCTTELAEVSRLKSQFEERGVKVAALSVDVVSDQEKWSDDIESTQGHRPNFPLIADDDRKVSDLYEMIHPQADNTLTVRTVFVIDPNKKVRLTLTYPASTGRNFEEILRVIDSMQLTDSHKVATPVNWRDGDNVIILPALSDEDAKQLFPDGWDAKTSYLRVIPQPK